jgi:arylsulfatase A-like enzyme
MGNRKLVANPFGNEGPLVVKVKQMNASFYSKSCWQVILAVVISGLCGFGAVGARAAETKPNIIFVMVDDLGYGDLGCYGQKRIKTPALDQMAREGMRFTDFYAGSTVCAPSRCVLMTGYHTGHCFIRGNGKDNLRPSDVTVAEVLKSAGYRTGLYGKWGLGHEGSSGLPTRQGFDHFYGYLDQHHAHNYYPQFLVRDETRVPLSNVVPKPGAFGQGVATEKKQYSHNLIMKEALKFVDRSKEGPFFLYLALTIPHANNEAGKRGMEVPDFGQYAKLDWADPQKGHAAMISLMDRDMGRLFDRLKQHGIDKNTIVFFTSDNGPHREGGYNPEPNDSNGPLRGIKRDLTEGGIRVPLIVRWPDHVPAGTTSGHVGAFWDVMPTLANLAGAKDHLPEDIDGINFASALRSKGAQLRHNFLFWAFYERGGARALRQKDWKIVQQPYHTPPRLYNLKDDLGETTDLASKHPDMVKRLVALMDQSYTPTPRWKFPQKRPAKK